MGRERREFGSIRKLASGRHQAVHTGPDLLRHVAPTTFQAKIDAEGWLHEERTLIEANDDGDNDKPPSPLPLTPGASAHFVLSRDPQGRDVVWTLAGDVDPAMPGPVR